MERESSDDSCLDPTQLLNLAQTHLRLRNYTLSRQYSLELLSSTTTRRSQRATATEVLTISDILSATATSTINHYSVLQLDSFLSDPNLIRSHFKKLVFILDPIKHSSPLAQQALQLVHSAHDCLSDPAKKSVFDAELMECFNAVAPHNGHGGFWTFCPYCFYVYEYDKLYEGCCLRCQNVGCTRVFHGVALTSLPKMELDKGRYFGCFGYFPMGFSPAEQGADRMAKFENWSPIVTMFPANRNEINLNADANGDGDGDGDGTDFIEILDDSDESDAGVKGEDNVPTAGSRRMRRKSVARRKRRHNAGDASAGERLLSDEGGDYVQEFEGRGDVGDLNEVDMAFFEGDGEVFVGLGSDDAATL